MSIVTPVTITSAGTYSKNLFKHQFYTKDNEIIGKQKLCKH